ncbi:hypothetical protein [Nesterenkonia muleiensis]|uniref:hypothetical protein n=1 Tax=Nesterenkonia muleiensis TaxID=2282648 RepID=UPI001300246D|nr:hypothetical protein [Nesterenkonia muleiensis]
MTETVRAEKAETETGIRQDDVPWGRGWNWLLTNPEKTGYRRVFFNGCGLLFGAVLAVYLFQSTSQDGLFLQLGNGVQVIGGSLGLVMLWAGGELRRAQKPLRDAEKLRQASGASADFQARRVSISSGSQA